MQSFAAKSPCKACGHRSTLDGASSHKPLSTRHIPVAQQRSVHRGDVRVEAAGSLVFSTLAAGVAAYYFSRQMDIAGEDHLQATARRPCPTCSGSGYEACHCTRWSDGDVGCSSCGRSGMMKCRSCGGGGTAVPIKVTVRKDF